MSPTLALFVCSLFVLWLFIRDRKQRGGVSSALWIPTCWVIILGSRPVSTWFGLGAQIESPDDYLEGSPFDRFFFLSLIAAGFLVLLKRRANWRDIVARNRWIAAYFLYFGISVLWSDYPFTAFKRWIKDFGNVIMVLVILSDDHPIEAFKAVLSRCLYLLIPASVLVIRYYPEIGRSYSRWTYEQFTQGVTLSKNQLGMTVAVCTLFLVWELLQTLNKKRSRPVVWIDMINGFILLAMATWLLRVANSATSLACTILGSCGLLAMRFTMIRKRLDNILTYSVIGVVLLLFLSTMFDFVGIGLKLLGRDATLTGRTDIWGLVLAEQVNPLVGAGFYSFWTGERIAKFWELYGVGMNQAHNGYLETYLIGGVIGVGLIVAVLVSAGRTIKKELVVKTNWGSIRLVFWLMTIVHNWTEASFSKLTLLWFLLLTVIMEYPRPPKAEFANKATRVRRSDKLREPVRSAC